MRPYVAAVDVLTISQWYFIRDRVNRTCHHYLRIAPWMISTNADGRARAGRVHPGQHNDEHVREIVR